EAQPGCRDNGAGANCAISVEPREIMMMMGTFQARRLLVLVAAAAAIALPFHPDGARSAEPPAQDPATLGSSSDSRQGMDSVTVEAKRDGQLKSQITKLIA